RAVTAPMAMIMHRIAFEDATRAQALSTEITRVLDGECIRRGTRAHPAATSCTTKSWVIGRRISTTGIDPLTAVGQPGHDRPDPRPTRTGRAVLAPAVATASSVPRPSHS